MSHENKVTDGDWEYPTPDGVFEYSNATTEVVTGTPQEIRELLNREKIEITRTIVAGSRTIYDEDVVRNALYHAPIYWTSPIVEFVHGGAGGVDTVVDEMARGTGSFGDVITVADYKQKYGTRGPILRNEDMAEYADNLIACWDGISNGTRDMIDRALDKGLNVYVHQI